ncbi:MAG: methyltransferase domain-containing protein [Anaerolineae bacterium]|nr:methyltransferase domain-containing protein [Anaerolineae bacterium]
MKKASASLLETCPNCGGSSLTIVYKQTNVPAHSVLLFNTREEARNFPKGDIALGFCQQCGFITNLAFDTSLHNYSAKYEATQSFSDTFNAFHKNLAANLIEKYTLRDKDIIEIGCGQGEFLTLLCEMGSNRGIGFDPAYLGNTNPDSQLTFIPDFYSQKYASYKADFICCKMTLEHIPNTADFVKTVRQSIDDSYNTTVFFQIPEVTRILREVAFWDIYYEHCSYFSPVSLTYLFQHSGFQVLDVYTDYDDQYLMIEAKPVSEPQHQDDNFAQALNALKEDVAYFVDNYPGKVAAWQEQLQIAKNEGQRVVIWGAGSKGVAFLTALENQNLIEYAVDINPRKHGTYMAGTGQKIVGPEFLCEYQPHKVIVMNPIYCPEIQHSLDQLGVTAELIPITL